MDKKEEKKLECIDYTDGAKTSDFLNGIEDFIRYQSKEISADLEHKAIFIVATDGENLISSPLGARRANIAAMVIAMKQDENIANMIKSALLLYSGIGDALDDIIKKIIK